MCGKAKNDIDKRIETVDRHLENLQTELLESVRIIKEKARLEYNRLSKETANKVNQYEQFSKEFKSTLDDFNVNKQNLMRNIKECQQHLNNLIFCEEKFRILFRKIRFESSDWLPDESFLCLCYEIFDK